MLTGWYLLTPSGRWGIEVECDVPIPYLREETAPEKRSCLPSQSVTSAAVEVEWLVVASAASDVSFQPP